MNMTWADVRAVVAARSEVDAASQCWNWTRQLTHCGYGRLFGQPAHRLAYMAHVGPIGKGLDIDHLCRNRACVNPSHLEPVTRSVNVLRGIRGTQQKEGAKARTHCSNGHDLAGNTYLRPSDGARICRVCRKAADERNRIVNRDNINARKRAKRLANKERKLLWTSNLT